MKLGGRTTQLVTPWIDLYWDAASNPGSEVHEVPDVFSSYVEVCVSLLFRFQATACKTVRPILSDRLSCPVLSVTLVYCAKRLDGLGCHLVWR